MFDSAEFPVTCPVCGRRTRKTIAWLKSACVFACPSCDSPVLVNHEGLLAALDRAERTISRIRQARFDRAVVQAPGAV